MAKSLSLIRTALAVTCVFATTLGASHSAYGQKVASALLTIPDLNFIGDFDFVGPQWSATFADAAVDGFAPIHTQHIAPFGSVSDTGQAVTPIVGPPENLFAFLASPGINAARADAAAFLGSPARLVAEAGVAPGVGASAKAGYVVTRGIHMHPNASVLGVQFVQTFALTVALTDANSIASALVQVNIYIEEASSVNPGASPDYRLGLTDCVGGSGPIHILCDDLPFIFGLGRAFCAFPAGGENGGTPGSRECDVPETPPLSTSVNYDLKGGSNYIVQLYTTAEVITSSVPLPEPETYALMIAGLALLCFATRRRSAFAASHRRT